LAEIIGNAQLAIDSRSIVRNMAAHLLDDVLARFAVETLSLGHACTGGRAHLSFPATIFSPVQRSFASRSAFHRDRLRLVPRSA
jgi:hypothetical protein